MNFEMSDYSQIVNVFNLRVDTKEFIGAGQAYVAAHTGIPANCTTVAPPEISAGYVAIYNPQTAEWMLAEDHRGQTVYDTQNGMEIFIVDIGAIPENTTFIAPTDDYQKWDGNTWVKDSDAEKAALTAMAVAKKMELLSNASVIIEPLQDAVELEIATEDEKILLKSWKTYRVLISRIDTSLVSEIIWPEKPLND